METLITAEDVKSGLSLIGSEGLTCDELAPRPWGSGGGGNRSVARQPEYGALCTMLTRYHSLQLLVLRLIDYFRVAFCLAF